MFLVSSSVIQRHSERKWPHTPGIHTHTEACNVIKKTTRTHIPIQGSCLTQLTHKRQRCIEECTCHSMSDQWLVCSLTLSHNVVTAWLKTTYSDDEGRREEEWVSPRIVCVCVCVCVSPVIFSQSDLLDKVTRSEDAHCSATYTFTSRHISYSSGRATAGGEKDEGKIGRQTKLNENDIC